MMKHTKRILTGAGVLAAAGGIAVAGTAASMASPAISSASTIRLHAHGGSATFVDVLQSKTTGPGDEIILAQPAFTTAHPGKVAGHLYVTVTFLTRSVAQAAGTVSLKGGEIELAGLSVGSSFKLAVTGGTGVYKNARGQAAVVEGHGKGNPSAITLSLIP